MRLKSWMNKFENCTGRSTNIKSRASAKAEVFAFEEDASSSLESGQRGKQKSPKGSALYVRASPLGITSAGKPG